MEVSGKLDVRGALAVRDDVRVGFELLSCRIRLRAAAGTDPRLLRRLVTAGERFCVNLDTLRNGVRVDIAGDHARSAGARPSSALPGRQP